MDYGKKIAYLRKTKGMTQEELGKVLNVTYQAVSKWERGESLPDFATMSQMAKFFQVPLGYFADESEEVGETAATSAPAAEAPAEAANVAVQDLIIGMCTNCGKMLKEDEVGTNEPKILCKSCAERLQKEKLAQQKAAEERREKEKQIAEEKREQQRQIALGRKLDLNLVISIVVALACFALFGYLTFRFDAEQAGLYGLLLFFAPVCAFGAISAFADLIKDKDDDDDGYRRNLSLIVAAIFSAINIGLFLAMYILFKDYIYLIMMAGGAVLSFTFVSQFMWRGVVRNVFTAGGFTFKLPGFIFTLDIESFVLMIIIKGILGFLSALLFIATTALIAGVAIAVSVVTFIPSVLKKTSNDKKA